MVSGDGNTPLDFPSGTGVQGPPAPVELENRRPRLFAHDQISGDKGVPDLLPNGPTPKRDRGEVESNDDGVEETDGPVGWERLHVDKMAPQLSPFQMDIQSDNGEFAQRHRVLVPPPVQSVPPAITPQMPSNLSLAEAIQTCALDLPDYESLYGCVSDPAFIKDVACDGAPYSGILHDTFTRTGADPVLLALRAAEATEVPLDDFRTRNASLDMELPLVGSSYRAWRLPKRRVCVARTYEWQVALRVGILPAALSRIV